MRERSFASFREETETSSLLNQSLEDLNGVVFQENRLCVGVYIYRLRDCDFDVNGKVKAYIFRFFRGKRSI